MICYLLFVFSGLSGLGGHMKKILVTGAADQIGSELPGFLRNIYGGGHVCVCVNQDRWLLEYTWQFVVCRHVKCRSAGVLE